MKKNKTLSFLIVLFGAYFSAYSQWYWDYSSPNSFPLGIIGTGEVTVNSGLVKFNNCPGGGENRAYVALADNNSSGGTLSTSFRLDFDFSFSANNASNGMSHWITTLTAGHQDLKTENPVQPWTIYQDMIGVLLQTPVSNSSANPQLYITAKKGQTQVLGASGIILTPGSYSITLERIAGSTLKLSVFTSPARTQLVGAPYCFTAFDATIGITTPLTYVQHGVNPLAGSDRKLTGTVDNVKLDNVVIPGIGSSQWLCGPGYTPAALTSTNNSVQFIGTYSWQTAPGTSGPWSTTGVTTPSYTPAPVSALTFYRRIYTYGCSQSYTSNKVWVNFYPFNATPDCDITDDYTNASLWTQTGTQVAVNSIGGNCSYRLATNDISRRVTRTLGNLPNDVWRMDFNFSYDNTTSASPSAYIAALTSSALDPLDVSQNLMFVGFGQMNTNNGNTYPNTCIWGGASKANSAVMNTSSLGIPVILGWNYTNYITLERISATQGRISVFTNSARTIHAQNSPQCFTIDPLVTGLNTIQHANNLNSVGTHSLTAQISNLCIDDPSVFSGRIANQSSGIEQTEKSPEMVSIHPNPGSGVFTISTHENQEGKIEVYDVIGRKIQSLKLNRDISIYKLDLSDNPKGVYIVNLVSTQKTQSKRIILE